MNFRYRFFPSLLFLCLLIPAFAAASTPEPPERPSAYVMDLAGIINADHETSINGHLRELDRKTGAQMIILTVQSLDGEAIDAFSIRMAEKWKPGHKEKDNGLLLTVAMKERRYRIEVGYGLEGILPDSSVGTIGRRYIVPNFKKGDYSRGIVAAASVLIEKIAGAEGVEISGRAARRVLTERRKGGPFSSIIGVIFLIAAVILFIKNPRLFILLLLFSGGGRRGWSGGGGGGFGGGGGGFGGGGASGGW